MHKSIILLLIMASVLTFTACKMSGSISNASDSASAERLPQPKLPLEKDVIMKTVEELGLSCVISEDESHETLARDNAVYVLHVLRDPERKYSEDGAEVLYAGITSGIVDGGRGLGGTFDARSHMLEDKPFAWEDWKEEIVFCSLLYGGFADKEEVYRALSRLEVPDDDNALKWGVQLSNGYCVVRRSRIEQRPATGYALWITFYETEERYLKAQQEQKEAFEKAQEDTRKRREAYLKKQREEAEAAAASGN